MRCRCWNAARCSRSLDLLKSTMLQLDPAFSERAYGAGSFSDFVDKLKKAEFINVSGSGGRYIIERRGGHAPEKAAPRPEEALPLLARRAGNASHGTGRRRVPPKNSSSGYQTEHPDFNLANFGFQQFSEFLNYAQDKTVVRTEPDEERGLIVHFGAEFYPPALPPRRRNPLSKKKRTSRSPLWKASRLSSSRIRRRRSRRRRHPLASALPQATPRAGRARNDQTDSF